VRPIAERLHGLLDRFVAFPGFPGVREREVDPRAIVPFLAWAQGERFDLAIQLHGNGVWTNPFTTLLGARQTVGFVRAEDSPYFLGLDAAIEWPVGEHEIHRLLRLPAAIGMPPAGAELELPIWPADDAEADAALAAGVTPERPIPDRPILALHPAGRFPDRTWPADRFVTAGRRIAAMTGARIVVTGGPDDAAVADEVAAGTDGLSVAGRLSLAGLAALYRRSALVVTNDSGPAHIAYAVDSPSVTIFGAASPTEWAPLDRSRHAIIEAAEPCRPCIDRLCIQMIPVEAVVDAAEGLVARGIVRADQRAARRTPVSSVALETRPGPTSDA